MTPTDRPKSPWGKGRKRWLVTGGRNMRNASRVNDGLTHAVNVFGNFPCLVIQGGATGADTLAALWAKSVGVDCVTEPADWRTHGLAAGGIRNQLMLDRYEPDVVIAFPGGRGTADMVSRAKAAGVPVLYA